MKRVNNPSKYLKDIVDINCPYYIGFGLDNLTNEGKNNKLLQAIISKKLESGIITGSSGPLKENTTGKFVRKSPGNKISKIVHIEYYSKRFEKVIRFDREFIVWEKELLHKYNLHLTKAITPQHEIIVHFPIQKYTESEEHFRLAVAAMNMSIQLGNYYLIYDENFEPIIPISKFKNRSILPPGKYRSVQEKLKAISDQINTGKLSDDKTGNSYRFAILKDNTPTEVTIGIGGFNDYLMFEFKESDLMILENLTSGNATYIFQLSSFDKDFHLDKSSAKKVKSFIERVIHENMDDWNKKIKSHFK